MPKKGSRSKAALSESKNGPFDEVTSEGQRGCSRAFVGRQATPPLLCR